MSPSRIIDMPKRTARVTVQMTPREKRDLENAAEAAGLTVSAYLRHLVKTAPEAEPTSDDGIIDEFVQSGAILIGTDDAALVSDVHATLREFCDVKGYDCPSKNLLSRRLTDFAEVQRDRRYVDDTQQRCLVGVDLPK